VKLLEETELVMEGLDSTSSFTIESVEYIGGEYIVVT
jgi:hypothetical protein